MEAKQAPEAVVCINLVDAMRKSRMEIPVDLKISVT
jgi:hypothetical protein